MREGTIPLVFLYMGLLDTVHCGVYSVYAHYINTLAGRGGSAVFIVLNGASDIPLYQQIVDQIKARILSGELAPGDPLPSIRQLATDLLTSVITTKRAYQELEMAGLIQTRTGLGTFVSQLRPGSAEQMRTEEIEAELSAVLTKARRMGIATEDLLKMIKKILPPEEDGR